MQLGHGAQLDAFRQRTAQETSGVVECLGSRLLLHGLAERREKYLGVRVVLRDFDVSDRDQINARILEFKPDDFRQLALDLVGDAPAAGKIFRHVIPDLQPAAYRRSG